MLSEPQSSHEPGTLQPRRHDQALKVNNRYECGDNLFKLDMTFSASASVPLSGVKIARLMRHYFAEPCALPCPCVVPVKARNPAERCGGHLPCVSPIEWRMALLQAVARDIQAREDGKVQAWRQHLLSCRFVYMFFDDEDELIRYARQIREDIAEDYTIAAVEPLAEDL